MQAGASAASRAQIQPSCCHYQSYPLLGRVTELGAVHCTPVDGVRAERQVRRLCDIPFVRSKMSYLIVVHPACLRVSSDSIVKQVNLGALAK